MHQRLLTARQARRNEDGFTLIELLIVIVILGVLSAIVVFSVRGITDRGDAAACKANLATAEVAVEAFYAKTGPTRFRHPALRDCRFLKSDPSARRVDAHDPGGLHHSRRSRHRRIRLRLIAP